MFSGHLSSPLSHEVNLLVCTDQDSRRLQWPDVQLMLLGRNFDTNKLRVYGYSQEVCVCARACVFVCVYVYFLLNVLCVYVS